LRRKGHIERSETNSVVEEIKNHSISVSILCRETQWICYMMMEAVMVVAATVFDFLQQETSASASR
jgi:hypothetical protein